MQLTKHFTLEELSHSDTAERLGIDNTPGQPAVGNLPILAAGLEQVRAMTGQPIRILSGYRCQALERVLCQADYLSWAKLKGKTTGEPAWTEYYARKAHPKGYAADFTCQAYGNPREIVRAVTAAGIKFDKLILEGTWVHISFDPQMRQDVLVAAFSKDGVTYAAGLT